MPLPHQMILASAGSGKTFQLTNRVLSLVRAGVEPSKIIALTFSRNAAAEFLESIMLRLAEAGQCPSKAAALSRFTAAPNSPPLSTEGRHRCLAEQRFGTSSRLTRRAISLSSWAVPVRSCQTVRMFATRSAPAGGSIGDAAAIRTSPLPQKAPKVWNRLAQTSARRPDCNLYSTL